MVYVAAHEITRKDWEKDVASCLSKGRAGNARVYRVENSNGTFVVKDFRKSPWWIRWTWGRWMIGHEFRIMKQLKGIEGVPQRLFRVDAYAFGMEFLPGEPLGVLNQRNADFYFGKQGSVQSRRLPVSYFRQLERLICAMHRRGVTHLDIRNAKNVLVLPDDRPGLIDFQSGVVLRRWFPRWIRKVLCLADLSSVYKHYYHFYFDMEGRLDDGPGGFPADRARILLHHLRLRRLWVLKGYTWFSRRKPKDYERFLMEMMGKDEKGGH